MWSKIIILLILISSSVYADHVGTFSYGGIGGYSREDTKEMTDSDKKLFERYTQHIEKKIQLSESDKNELNKNGKLDENLMYVVSMIMSNNGNLSYDDVQWDIFDSLATTEQRKEMKNFLMDNSNEVTSLKKFNNKSFLISFTQGQLYKNIPNARESKISEMIKQISDSKTSVRINKLFNGHKNIFLDKDSFDNENNLVVIESIRNYLKAEKGYDKSEISDYYSEYVFFPDQIVAIDKLITPSDTENEIPIDMVLNHQTKWSYLKKKLNEKYPRIKAEKIFNNIRAKSNTQCSFRPEKFGEQDLMNEIIAISGESLKGTPEEINACAKKIKNFKQTGSSLNKLINIKKTIKDSSNSPQYGGSSLYLSTSNRLGNQIADFLNAGCEFKEGNGDILDLASRFTGTLGASATTLSSGSDMSLYASTLSAITALTSTLMKMFKQETDTEKAKRMQNSLANRQKYLTQMCSFKNFVYRLDSVLAGNKDLENVYQLAMSQNNVKINKHQSEIGCLENLKETSQLQIIIADLDRLDLTNGQDCIDFVMPFFEENYISDQSSTFYKLYKKDCLENKNTGDIKNYCHLYKMLIPKSQLSTTSIVDICGNKKKSKNLNMMYKMIRGKMTDLLVGKGTISIEERIRLLNKQLADIRKSNSNLQISLGKTRAQKLTEDMKTYVSTTGSVLFGTDEDSSPMIAFFENSKKEILKSKERLKKVIEDIQNKNQKKTQLCDIAPTAVAELNTLNEQRRSVRSFCRSFIVDTRTPFESRTLRTNSFANPTQSDGLNEQCENYYTEGYNNGSDVNLSTLFTYLAKECES